MSGATYDQGPVGPVVERFRHEPQPDLSPFAKKDEVEAVAEAIPDVSGLARKSEVQAVAASIPDVSGLASKTSVQQVAAAIPDITPLALKSELTPLARKSEIPVVPPIDTAAPLSEKNAPAAGASGKVSDSRHRHERLSSTTYVTIGANGKAQVDFARKFSMKPGLNFTETEAVESSEPVQCRSLNWIQDSNGMYVGVNIQAFRFRALPNQNPVTLGALLAGVITGVNNLVTSLTGFRVTGGSAQGAIISCIALEQSAVTAS